MKFDPRLARLMLPLAFFAALACLLPASLHAQAGSTDTGFVPGNGGAGADNYPRAVAIQADQKILLAGEFTFGGGIGHNHIGRLNTDGSVDTNFLIGSGTDGGAYCIAVGANGKIVVGGIFAATSGNVHKTIVRLNADGSVDNGFAVQGTDSYVEGVAVQDDGKVILGGYFSQVNGTTRHYIARLNVDGSLDPVYFPGTDNYVIATKLQSDGKCLIVGEFSNVASMSRPRVARLNTDGTLDKSFDPGSGADGTVRTVAQQPDGKIVIGGDFNTVGGVARHHVARLNPDGTLDTTFDPGSGVGGDRLRSLAIAADGKIVIAGDFTDYQSAIRSGITRLNSDGSLDTSFITSKGATGTAATPSSSSNGAVFGIAIQADGKTVLVGDFGFVNGVAQRGVGRLNGDPPVVNSVLNATGQVGQPFNYQITGTFAPGSFYATTLPPGLAINTASGLISGIPTASGSFSVTLSAINGSGTGTASLTVTVMPPSPAPVVTSPASVAALVGAPFSFAISATNSPTSYAAVGLPPGLSLDGTTGLITGTPTQAGMFNATISATNIGGTGTASLNLTITVPPANIAAVNILSPPTNIAIVAGETIDLQVAVEAVNGTLGTVEFDVTDAGGTRTYLGNSTAPRDHKTWNPTALGDFTLSATATDTTGKTARSEIPIHVVAGTNPPVSQLLSGLDGKTFAAGSTLSLVALATDAGGQPLANVQFYLDGVLIPGVTTAAVLHRQDAAASPYAKTNARLGNLIGDALLTMTGTDGRGVTSVSKAANVHIKAATAMFNCAITSPDGSGTFAPGQSVTATATAVETGGSVGQVEYFLNDRSVGVSTSADFPLAFALPGTAGQYALTAIATDTAGVSAASAPVILSAVETLLPPPTVTIAVAGNTSVEEGSNAKLVLRREGGDTSRAVTVRYKLAGAARAGADYKPLIGSVVIPAGAPSAKLKLKTIDNATADGTRVVKIKLLPATDGSYTLGNPATAKLKITDND